MSVATFRGGQNLNFAIPSSYLKKLMEQIGPVKPFPKEKPTGSKSSIFADLGGKGTKGITAGKILWGYRSWELSYSLRNHLRQNVEDVHYYIIFYDKLGDPIDVEIETYRSTIPAGLARRVEINVFGDGVPSMVKDGGKIEFRILDFEIVE